MDRNLRVEKSKLGYTITCGECRLVSVHSRLAHCMSWMDNHECNLGQLALAHSAVWRSYRTYSQEERSIWPLFLFTQHRTNVPVVIENRADGQLVGYHARGVSQAILNGLGATLAHCPPGLPVHQWHWKIRTLVRPRMEMQIRAVNFAKTLDKRILPV